ncbi:MAG: hypothetical protein R3F48_02535 [Candidatus Zixiibacteriota bacterium]
MLMGRMQVFLLACTCFIMVGFCRSSSPKVPQPMETSIKPIGDFQKQNPIKLNIASILKPGHNCNCDNGEVYVFVCQIRALDDTLCQFNWGATVQDSNALSKDIEFTVPDNDTSLVFIETHIGRYMTREIRTFITTGPSIEYYTKFKIPPLSKYKSPDTFISQDPKRDTLTSEQLGRKYEVILNLKNPEVRERAQKILGQFPDSCLVDVDRQYYKMKLTLETIIKLGDKKVGFEYTTFPPWDNRYKPNDSVIDKNLEINKDSLYNKVSPSSIDGISLDHVDGLATTGVVRINEPINWYPTQRVGLFRRTCYRDFCNTPGRLLFFTPSS